MTGGSLADRVGGRSRLVFAFAGWRACLTGTSGWRDGWVGVASGVGDSSPLVSVFRKVARAHLAGPSEAV